MYRNLHFVKLISALYLFMLIICAGCNNGKEVNVAGQSDPKIAALKLPAGFHAEHLYSPGIHDQGSWVAMTFDNKGRMIASD